MSFLMSLRDDDTYTYIKNNLVSTGPPVVPIANKFVLPYKSYKGMYYSWVWNGTYWVLTDNDSTVYTETEPPNPAQSTSYTRSAPSPIVPYNGFGYYCIGTGTGFVKIKKIDFSTLSVTTVESYNVTHDTLAECDSTVYGNYALFICGMGNNLTIPDQTEASLEVVKVYLPDESCTQLYSADDTTDGNFWNSIGCDGTNVFIGSYGRDPEPSFYVPLSGGGTTRVSLGVNMYGERAWGRRSFSGTRYIYDFREGIGGFGETFDVSSYLGDQMPVYIMDDTSYPVYTIVGNETSISALKLNLDGTITFIEEIAIGSFNTQYLADVHPVLYGKERTVLYFPANTDGSRNSVEIRLPYKDIL